MNSLLMFKPNPNNSQKTKANSTLFLSPYFTEYLRNQKSTLTSNLIKRNIDKIRAYTIKSYTIGKYGFKRGIIFGSCLGCGLGIIQTIKTKNILVLPFSIAGSGLVFGSMFAFSTVLKSQ